jgi:hypothetical protein
VRTGPLAAGGDILLAGWRTRLAELRRGGVLGSKSVCFRFGEDEDLSFSTDLETVAGLADVVRGLLLATEAGFAVVGLVLVEELVPPLPPLLLRSKGGMDGLAEERAGVVIVSRMALISGGIGML